MANNAKIKKPMTTLKNNFSLLATVVIELLKYPNNSYIIIITGKSK